MVDSLEVEDLVSACQRAFHARDYVRAVDLAERALALAPADPKANYYAALLFRIAGKDPKAAEHMQRSGLSPGIDFDYTPYEEFLTRRQAFLDGQADAIARGRPAMTIAALGKSASAFVSNFTATALGMPTCRIAVGNAVVPNWARRLQRGGGINHEHFEGTPANVRTLVEAGIDRIAILVRDPRQQIVSLMHHNLSSHPHLPVSQALSGRTPEEQVGIMMSHGLYQEAVTWIARWTEIAQKQTTGLTVRFVTYEDLVKDRCAFLLSLWEFFGLQVGRPELQTALDQADQHDIRWNFRRGRTDEWRDITDADTQTEMWRQLPPAIVERFAWQR